MLSRRLALHRPFQGHIACPKPKVVCALSLKRYIRLGVFTTTPQLQSLRIASAYILSHWLALLYPFPLYCYSPLLFICATPSFNSPLCLSLSLSLLVSLSLCALWSCLPRLKHCLQSWNITLLCSLFLILQTETLSAELKYHSQSWNITLFGSLVFSAELPWQ